MISDEELNKVRDEMAEALKANLIARRAQIGSETVKSGFSAGFDACAKLMREEITEISIKLQRTVNAAHGALLETTAWMGIPENRRAKHIEEAMSNVKYCAEHDLRDVDESQRNNQLRQAIADYREALKDIASDLFPDVRHIVAQEVLAKHKDSK